MRRRSSLTLLKVKRCKHGWMERKISAAGNTVVPAILALEAAGFQVSTGGDYLIAEKDGETLVAEDPVAVLGLGALGADRGWEWLPSDEEIDQTLRRFGRE
jgi:hypothetical protein